MGNCKTKIVKNTHKSKNKTIIIRESNEPNDGNIVTPWEDTDCGQTVQCAIGQLKELSDGDIVIPLGKGYYTKLNYNVSEFLWRHQSSRAYNQITNVNAFVRHLDEKSTCFSH